VASSSSSSTFIASGRLKGCSSNGGSVFTGLLETGESLAPDDVIVVPGFDNFFWFFTTFRQHQQEQVNQMVKNRCRRDGPMGRF